MSDIIAGVQCPAFVAVDFNVRPLILLEFNVRHCCWNLPLDFPSVWICDAVLNFWRWYSIFWVTSDFVKVQVMQAKIIWTRNTLRFDLFKKINVTNLILHLFVLLKMCVSAWIDLLFLAFRDLPTMYNTLDQSQDVSNMFPSDSQFGSDTQSE